MKLKKKIIASILSLSLIFGSFTPNITAFADSSKVVTIGVDLSDSQKQTVLDYFGVKENEVAILEVNNQEERKYMEGIASEAQIGTRTYSCAYVQPTKKGNGINAKAVNLTYVTSSMIASTLATCGVTDVNVIAMSPITGGVSGTGALTGIMKAFEDATGEKLDETKKQIASEELITTSDLGNDVGQDKATGVINDIKTEVIKNGTKDTTQIAETINNVTNNYNITLNAQQQSEIEALMKKIAEQDYDYDNVKNTFKNVAKNVDIGLKKEGITIDRTKGFFNKIGNFFSSIWEWIKGLFSSDTDLGILKETNDNALGDNVKIDATDEDALSEEDKKKQEEYEKSEDKNKLPADLENNVNETHQDNNASGSQPENNNSNNNAAENNNTNTNNADTNNTNNTPADNGGNKNENNQNEENIQPQSDKNQNNNQ